MKYTAGVLGLLLVSSCVWAEPESMTMVATLSAPIASFGSVEVEDGKINSYDSPDPVDMTYGQGDDPRTVNFESYGTITLTSDAEPLNISQVNMGEETTFEVSGGATWFVDQLTLKKGGTIKLSNGTLIVNNLTFPNTVTNEIKLTVKNRLILDSALSSPEVKKDDLESLKLTATENKTKVVFNFESGTSQSGSVKVADWD